MPFCCYRGQSISPPASEAPTTQNFFAGTAAFLWESWSVLIYTLLCTPYHFKNVLACFLNYRVQPLACKIRSCPKPEQLWPFGYFGVLAKFVTRPVQISQFFYRNTLLHKLIVQCSAVQCSAMQTVCQDFAICVYMYILWPVSFLMCCCFSLLLLYCSWHEEHENCGAWIPQFQVVKPAHNFRWLSTSHSLL